MHEFGLASDIVDAVIEAAEGRRVVKVHVDMGPSNHADPAILNDAFEIAAGGTLAANAMLEFTPSETDGVVVTAIDVE